MSKKSIPGINNSFFQRSLEFIFYGNIFYGICVISLIYETTVLFNLEFGNGLIYLIAFACTCLFYNYPYARIDSNPSHNPRIFWHSQNQSTIRILQILCVLIIILGLGWIIISYFDKLFILTGLDWILILIFPIVGIFYYSSNFASRKYNIRQIGWMKPFAIGFVWAGITNVYPILYSILIHSNPADYSLMMIMQFFKTFLFISILAILFDIKDHRSDHNSQLKTLIVKLGLRKTILYVIIPFSILGLIIFSTYALILHFSLVRMMINMIPFILIILVTKSFKKRRPLLFYLIIIDGLIVVKALLGIISS